MKIKLGVDHHHKRYDIAHEINGRIQEASRFKLNVMVSGDGMINLSSIRLKTSKEYCGNHPNECEVNFGGKPRKAQFLEGADWVEFNDLLNDILDDFHASANVASSVCIIRKGSARRVRYDSHRDDRNQMQWDKDQPPADFQDWCGKVAPNSEYPEGTPGIYTRLAHTEKGNV